MKRLEDHLSIVIPVYNALEETIACIQSILESDAKSCRVFVLDDCSFSSNSVALREFVSTIPTVTLYRNFRNRGYTRNIQFGLDASDTEYVCLLNSDTLLPAFWATPILAAIGERPSIAAVGPVSNAASYQSVPEVYDSKGQFSTNGSLGLGAHSREFISQVGRSLLGQFLIDVPNLNGFCTVFRKSALVRVGGFDVESYPEGYGEENDLCFRLKAMGYRLSVLPSVFVHHQKSKSFGGDRRKVLALKGSETFRAKFGESALTRISDQLRGSRELAVSRMVYEFAAGMETEYGMPQLQVLPETVGEGPLGPGSFALCKKISGPGVLLVGGGKWSFSREPADRWRFGLARGVFDLSVPEGQEIDFWMTQGVYGLLLALAVKSFAEEVFVDAWELGNGGKELLGSDVSRIPFRMLFPGSSIHAPASVQSHQFTQFSAVAAADAQSDIVAAATSGQELEVEPVGPEPDVTAADATGQEHKPATVDVGTVDAPTPDVTAADADGQETSSQVIAELTAAAAPKEPSPDNVLA